MFLNKGARIQPAAGIFAVARADERSGELAHFEMQMGKVAATSCADGGNLVASMNVGSASKHAL